MKARERGFTLVELAVTISIAALLLSVVLPYFGTAISNARARNAVTKFTQDFSSLRNTAATGSHVAVLTLNTDCSWSATVDTVADASHSMATAVSGFSCAGQNGTTLPITFNFSPQGFVTPSAAILFTSPKGQTWPLQVLGSGTIAITTGSS